jgi:hypothetical protein
MGTPMAFTTGTTYTYTDRMFKRGTIGLNLPSTLAPGYNWFNGVDVSASQYLIYSDTYTTGIASQANSKPTAWTTPDKTDASLLGLINTLPERIGQTSFTNVTDATTWLQESNRYFLINSGYEDIVTSGLTLSWDAAWYNSFKTGNTLWYDISGNYVNGTFTNGPSFSTSNGGSISFDGTDDYVSASVSSPGPPITVETICRFNNVDADSGNYRYVFSLGDGGVGQMISLSKAILTNPAGTLRPNQGYVYLGGGNEDMVRNIDYVFTGSAYHHVVIQVLSDNQTIKCFIDGVEVGVQNNTQTISLGTILNLGRWFNNTWHLNGNIQTFRIYNRTLSQAEILKNYNTQKGRIGYDNIISSGLKLMYDMTNPLTYTSGTTIYDLSGNKNNGTLINGTSFSGTSGNAALIFDGTDDYVQFTPISVRTVQVWGEADIGADTGLRALVGVTAGGDGSLRFDSGTFRNANSADLNDMQKGFPTDLWINGVKNPGNSVGGSYVVPNNGSMTAPFFVSVKANPSSYTSTVSTLSHIFMGRVLKGKIYRVAMYDRDLTQSEILQNYYMGNIVTSGLTMGLDSGNVVSYRGVGNVVKDLTNTKSGATLINGTSYTFLNNGALVFDGTDDYATVASSSDWAFGANGTVSMWAYFTGNLTANHRFWCTNNQETYLDAYLDGATGLVGFHGGSTLTTTLFPRDQWVNLTVTYIGGIITVYYNGVPQPLQGTTTGYNISNTGTLFIGQYAGGGGYTWRGRMSTLFTYNRGLSAMEVQQNFNAHRGRYGL